MGTDIFKIEKEMTKKMKPKVANPPLQNGQNIGVLFLKGGLGTLGIVTRLPYFGVKLR